MSIIRINTPVPGDGERYVVVTFPQDKLDTKVYASGDLVKDWLQAVSFCINAILSKKVENPWLSYDTQAFDQSDALHDYLIAWLCPIHNGWELRYGNAPLGNALKVYVPRDKVMTYEQLKDYCMMDKKNSINMKNTVEIMSAEFTKYRLDLSEEGWTYYQPLLHHFTGPDKGGPHDHPWDFTIHVLKGGYIEKVYRISDDGYWSVEYIARLPGTVHHLTAECIHEIHQLLEDDCWTIAVPGLGNRDWRMWSFSEFGVSYRVWNEKTWIEYKKSDLIKKSPNK